LRVEGVCIYMRVEGVCIYIYIYIYMYVYIYIYILYRRRLGTQLRPLQRLVQGLWFGAWGLGFRVALKPKPLWFRVKSLGFRV